MQAVKLSSTRVRADFCYFVVARFRSHKQSLASGSNYLRTLNHRSFAGKQ